MSSEFGVQRRRSHMGLRIGCSLAIMTMSLFASGSPAQAQTTTGSTTIGGINLGNLTNYLLYFDDGSTDANWQGATKGFVGDVAVNGLQAKERTSGSVPYAGTLYSNASTLGPWQNIINSNAGQAQGVTNQGPLIAGLHNDLVSALQQINALPASANYSSVSASSLNGLNTQDGHNEVYVINVTSGLQVSNEIHITGDPGDVFILRWDTDGNPTNGYQGQVKFQSGGGIVPEGGLTPSNFINVAGDINSSGGGTTPAVPFPQGPRYSNGQGSLIKGGNDFNGGGFFTGYWLTTGSPTNYNSSTGLYTGATAPQSNGIFVGGWYTLSTKFSLTSGTSGVYISPNPSTFTGTTIGATVMGQGVLNETQTYDWNITKSACESSLVIKPGTSQSLQYTLQATRALVSDTEQTSVTGSVYVTNEGSQPTEGLQIAASLENVPGATTMIVPDEQLQPGQTMSYPVQFLVPGGNATNYTLDANVTITNYIGSLGSPMGPSPAEESIVIPSTPTITTQDDSATISDVVTSPPGFTYTTTQTGPWTLDNSGTITYDMTVNNVSAPAGMTYELDNTATLVEDTSHTQKTASTSVSISTGSTCGG